MDFLKELGIKQNNYGTCVGGEEWIKTGKGKKLNSINPSTGEIIASVYQASDTDYEKVMEASEDAFNQWKKVPAPVRGQLIREIGFRKFW